MTFYKVAADKMKGFFMPTGKQIRAARVLVDWGAEDLAQRVGVSRVTIQNIEHGVNKRPRIETMNRIAAAFESMGVEFLDHDGVRRRPTEVRTFEGIDGFSRFYDLVYSHLNEHGGQACVCGSSSAQFAKYRPDVAAHRLRMVDLARRRSDFSMRFLAEEGDMNMPNAAYATYRWMPKENFPPVAFYSFGEYKAEITFQVQNPPLVVAVKSQSIADAYNKFFDFMWKNAKEVPQK